jgi:hypothetical protein
MGDQLEFQFLPISLGWEYESSAIFGDVKNKHFDC